jgi:ubiquitin carboxyl-terminal hydrolase 22/27/51
MSVILQSFVHNPLLRNFYLSDGHQAGNCVQEDCLSCGMDEIFQEFYAHDTTAGFCASNLLATVWAARKFLSGYDGLTGDVEHDAHEFFQFLAEKLHETETSQSRASDGAKLGNSCECIIHQTFYGKTQTNMTCTHCGATSIAVQPFLNLDLTIGGAAKKRIGKGKKGDKGGQKAAKQLTLYQCLDEEYRQSEDCARTCHSCYGHQECRKQTVIKRLPNVLCIQIKVFFILSNKVLIRPISISC